MVDTVRIGGIKLSEELVQVDLREPMSPGAKSVRLLNAIASAKVNIPHLHQGTVGREVQTSFCISRQDYSLLQHTLPDCTELAEAAKIETVGTISLFPHGSGLFLAAKILHVLQRGNIPIYGVSTSISALVVHTDYTLLDAAVEQILTVCHLPENHTPLRPVIVLGDEEIETVAVYWEPQIRIYGMEIKDGLADIQLTFSPAAFANKAWCSPLLEKEKFNQLSIHMVKQDEVKLNMLILPGRRRELLEVLTDAGGRQEECGYTHFPPGVEMVSFHGPHFQDRYGIAAMAFSQLEKGGVCLLRSACTGTSVQFIAAAGKGKEIAACLADTFVVP